MTAAFRRYVASILAALGLKHERRPQPIRKPMVRPRVRLGGEALEDRLAPAVFDVSLVGNDLTGDGSAANPFRTMQRAIDQAAAALDGNDVINIAGGVYGQAGVDLAMTVPNSANITNLSLLGGWNNAFTARDPNLTPTTLAPQTIGGVGMADFSIFDANVTIDAVRFRFAAGGLQATDANGLHLFGSEFTRVGPADAAGAALVRVFAAGQNVTGVQLADCVFDGGAGVANSNGLVLQGGGGFIVGDALLTNLSIANASATGLTIANAGTIDLIGAAVTAGGNGVALQNLASGDFSGLTVAGNALAGFTAMNAVPGALSLTDLTLLGNGSGGSVDNVQSFSFTASMGVVKDVLALAPNALQLTRAGVQNQALALSNLTFVSVLLEDGDDELVLDTAVYSYTIIKADGGGGTDTVAFNATAADDAIRVNGTDIEINGNLPPVQGAILLLGSFEARAVNGLGGGDVFTVEATTVPVSLRGGDGDDVFNLGLAGSMNLLGVDLLVDGGTGVNTLNFNDQAEVASHAYAAAGGQASRDGAFTAFYSSIQNLTLNGGSGSDAFVVTPDAFTTFTVGGNPPNFPAAPGDTLTLNLAGVTNPQNFITGPGDGIFNFGNALPVGYLSIETLNTGGTAYDLVLNVNFTSFGNDGIADVLRLSLNAAGDTLLLDRLGDAPAYTGLLFRGAAASVRSFSLIGSSDDDTLILQETAGGLPSFAGNALGAHLNPTMQGFLAANGLPANIGLQFEGGGGFDRLRFQLSSARQANYFADRFAPRSGNINLGAGGGAGGSDLRVSFSGLAPVDFFGAGGTLFVDATSFSVGGERFTMQDDANAGDGVSQIVSSDLQWEDVNFSGYQDVRFTAGSFGQTLIYAGLDANASETSVTLDGDNFFGTEGAAGTDTFLIPTTTAGVALSLLGGGGNDTFNLGMSATGVPANLDAFFGDVLLDGQAGANLLLVFDVTSATANANAFILADTILGLAGPTDASVINYLATGGSFSAIQVNGSDAAGAAEVYTVQNPNGTFELNANGGNDTINVVALTHFATLNGGDGADAFNLGTTLGGAPNNLDSFLASVLVDGGAGANFLTVYDITTATANSNAYIGFNSITGLAGPTDAATILYQAVGGSFALIAVDGGDAANDRFTIENPNGQLLLSTNGGDDTVNVVALANFAALFGGAGADTFNLGTTVGGVPNNLDGLLADVNVDGGTGANVLNVFDVTTATANANAVIGTSTITGLAGPSDNRTITYQAIGGTFSLIRVDGSDNAATAENFTVFNPNGPLLLNLNAGNDTANLQSLINAATVNGGAGNDTFNLGLAGLLDFLAQPITLDGGAGGNVINLDDSANAIGRLFTFDAALITRDGGIQVSYGNVQLVNLTAGVGSDVINVTPAVNTAFNLGGNLPVLPASPGDTLNIDLAGTTGAGLNLTGIGDGNFTFANRQAVAYTSIETLNATNGSFDLVLDLNAFIPWGNDGVADVIEARLNGTGTMLELARLGAPPDFIGLFFTINVAPVRSFTMIGSTDSDTLIVRETAGGLLGTTGGFGGTAIGSHLNGTMQQFLTSNGQPTNVGIHFDGGAGGADRLTFVLASLRNAWYFADRAAPAGSGNVSLGAAGGGAASALRASFGNLTPVDFIGAGGTLFVDATSFSSGGEVFTLQDDATAGDGVSQLICNDVAFETANFSGYSAFRFTAGNFGETLVYAGVDSLAPPASVVLDGDNFFGTEGAAGADTFNIPLTTAGVALTLLGGGGNDTFNLGAAANGVPNNLNAFANSVSVDGQAGANVLNVFDNTSAAGNANVVIGFSTITGIAGPADAAVISYQATGGSFSLIRVDGSDTLGDVFNVQNPNGPLQANGNGGADIFNVQTLTQPATLNGGAGDDTFNFGQANLINGITGAVTVNGGTGTNVINVNDGADAVSRIFNLMPTLITRDGGFNVTYSAIAAVTLNAGVGSDTFTAAPSTTTVYFINGNLPILPANPGDRLTVDLAGTAGAALNVTGPGDGNFTFTNRQTVNFTSIETLDATNGQYDLVLNLNNTPFGNDGIADLIEARLRAVDTSIFELARLGSPPAYVGLLFAGTASAIRSLAVIGSTDADTLRIREVNNLLPGQTGGFGGVALGSHLNTAMQFYLNSVGASTNVGIQFDGGPGAASDRLQFQFTSARVSRFFADAQAAPKSGNVNVSGVGGSPASDLRLSFSSLTPIDFFGAGGELIVDNTAMFDAATLTVADDAIAGDGISQVTSSNLAFETVFFSGYDALTVLGGTGGQNLIMDGLDAATSTTLVTLDGDDTFGTDAGNDVFETRRSAGSVTTRMLGGGGDDLFMVADTSGVVDNVLGPVFVFGEDGTDTLRFDDSGSLGGGVYTITNATIRKAGFGLVTYGTIEELTALTSQGADQIDILGSLATTPIRVFAGAGADAFNVCSTAPSLLGNLDGIEGALRLDGEGGANVLNVSDFGGLTANADAFIGVDSITGFAGSADATAIGYFATGGSFSAINILGADAVGERFTVLDPNGPLNLSTFGGADQVFVVAISFIANVDTGAGDDLVVVSSTPLPYPFPGNLDGINATLNLEGGSGQNTFNLNDQTTATANANVFITTTQFLNFAGAADDQVVNYASTGGQTFLIVAGSDNATTPEVFTLQRPGGQLDLFLLAGNDTANVQGIDFQTNIDAGAGDDQLNVGSTTPSLLGNLDQINATLNLEAGLGANILRVTDQTTTTANAGVVVTVSRISGFAGAADGQLINYFASGGSYSLIQIEGADSAAIAEDFTILSPNGPLTLNLNGGPDTARIRSLTTQATVNGGAGDDTLIASSSGLPNFGSLDLIDAPLALNAGSGNNVIHLVDFDGAPNPNVIFTDSAVSGLVGPTNNQVVTYSYAAGAGNSLTINVQLSNLGGDWFTVNSTLAGSVANIFGNGGDDEFLVNSFGGAAPGRMNLYGGAGNEEFAFADGASLSDGFIDGGSGVNQMNYVTWTAGVTVNLETGVAAGLDLALTGGRIAVGTLQNIIGGAGNDFLIGDFQNNRIEGRGGNNTISGQAGDDILVGGAGNDYLVGSAGNDLIYGGGGRDALFGDYVKAGLVVAPIPGSLNNGPAGYNAIVLYSCNDLRQGRGGARVIDVGGSPKKRGRIVVAKFSHGQLVGPVFVKVGPVTLGPLLPYLQPRYTG